MGYTKCPLCLLWVTLSVLAVSALPCPSDCLPAMHDKQAENNELCTARRDPIDPRIEHISSHTVMLPRYSDGIQDGTLLVPWPDV